MNSDQHRRNITKSRNTMIYRKIFKLLAMAKVIVYKGCEMY